MIEQVIITPLKQIIDDKGKILHMLRADSVLFNKFGEIYFSLVNPGVVKAWKKHKLSTQLFAVPVGEILLVLYDNRENSKTKEEIQIINIGESNYKLVRITPMVWYDFKGISKNAALIANCTDIPHDPLELERSDVNNENILYVW